MKSESAQYFLGLGFEIVAFNFRELLLSIQTLLIIWISIFPQDLQGFGYFLIDRGGQFQNRLLPGWGTLLG